MSNNTRQAQTLEPISDAGETVRKMFDHYAERSDARVENLALHTVDGVHMENLSYATAIS